jgi:pre-mRNA-processing factor 6
MLEIGAVETSRAIYFNALTLFPKKKSLWMKAIELERKCGSPETIGSILKKAVESCGKKSELFYLMLAKHLWKNNNEVEEAKKLL